MDLVQSQCAFTTVTTVKVLSHEYTTSTLFAFSSGSGNVTIRINRVVLQYGQFNLFVYVLVFLWSCVLFFLSLFTTPSQSQDQVQGRFLLDVVVGQGTPIFQLLTSKDQSLLIRWNSYRFVCLVLIGCMLFLLLYYYAYMW